MSLNLKIINNCAYSLENNLKVTIMELYRSMLFILAGILRELLWTTSLVPAICVKGSSRNVRTFVHLVPNAI